MITVIIHQFFADESLVNEAHEVLQVASAQEAERVCFLLQENDQMEGHFKSYYRYEICDNDDCRPTTTVEAVVASNHNLHLNV